jgi:hypothetical protein
LPVLLPLKLLTENDVTDVATLGSSIINQLFALVGRKSRFISAHFFPAAECYDGAMVNSNFTGAKAKPAEMAANPDGTIAAERTRALGQDGNPGQACQIQVNRTQSC